MQQFFFNEHHNFWPIYDTIKQYYPLGLVEPARDQKFIQRYPGLERVWEIACQRLSDYREYQQRWKPFQEHLKAGVKKRVTPDEIISPCYSGHVPLKKRIETGWQHTKELHFAISLLGPYYTIFGLDTMSLELPEDEHPFEEELGSVIRSRKTVPIVTVSPYQEYATLFSALEQAILAYFPDYRLVPYTIGSMTLQGLVIDNDPEIAPTVYSALFHSHIPKEHREWPNVRGDKFYGHSQWRNNLPQIKRF